MHGLEHLKSSINNHVLLISSIIKVSGKANLNTLSIERKIHKLWLGGHIVCQPIRSLQVRPDLPDRPHVSVDKM